MPSLGRYGAARAVMEPVSKPTSLFSGTDRTIFSGRQKYPAVATLHRSSGKIKFSLSLVRRTPRSARCSASGNQTITATDTVTSSITGTSNAITVGAAAATHFAVSAPASATAGSAFNFTVSALDAFNNTATSYAGTVHFTSSDGAATLPANSTLTNGTGTFSATLATAGNQTITATDTVTSEIPRAWN